MVIVMGEEILGNGSNVCSQNAHYLQAQWIQNSLAYFQNNQGQVASSYPNPGLYSQWNVFPTYNNPGGDFGTNTSTQC